jgi:hypothetical protein
MLRLTFLGAKSLLKFLKKGWQFPDLINLDELLLPQVTLVYIFVLLLCVKAFRHKTQFCIRKQYDENHARRSNFSA